MTVLATAQLETTYGRCTVRYHKHEEDSCITLSLGETLPNPLMVRIHSSCLFGEAFGALDCDCGQQLMEALRLIQDYGSGVIVYLNQEGRGIGLLKKIQVYNIQQIDGVDTREAFKQVGFSHPDQRGYAVALAALRDIWQGKQIHLLTNNPDKRQVLEANGYDVTTIAMHINVAPQAARHLQELRDILGHIIA